MLVLDNQNRCVSNPVYTDIIPEYRYQGLQISMVIPANFCRYLPVLRKYKMGTFHQNDLLLKKMSSNCTM
jgi:hypothetical protein